MKKGIIEYLIFASAGMIFTIVVGWFAWFNNGLIIEYIVALFAAFVALFFIGLPFSIYVQWSDKRKAERTAIALAENSFTGYVKVVGIAGLNIDSFLQLHRIGDNGLMSKDQASFNIASNSFFTSIFPINMDTRLIICTKMMSQSANKTLVFMADRYPDMKKQYGIYIPDLEQAQPVLITSKKVEV